MAANRVPLDVRFHAKYEKRYDGCWVWIAAKDKDGYGCIQSEGDKVRAHRVSWELHHGEIPPGLVICHHCDNPSCVNPDHLFLGTVGDNNADMYKKRRNPRGKLHGMAKLCPDDVKAIRKIAGKTGKDIAKAYGVSKSLVGMIRQRVIWRDVA